MCLRQETLYSLAIYDELVIVARDEVFFLELDQMLGDSRARRADQIGEVAMPGVDSEFDTFSIADAEVLAQFEQDQGEALFEGATHEVGASELHEIPSAQIAGRHPLEVFGIDSERNFDKFLQLDSSDVAIGDSLAAEVVLDSDHSGREAGNHAGRDHDEQSARALAVAAANSRDAGEQDVGEIGRTFLFGDYAAFFDDANREGAGQFVELARGEP